MFNTYPLNWLHVAKLQNLVPLSKFYVGVAACFMHAIITYLYCIFWSWYDSSTQLIISFPCAAKITIGETRICRWWCTNYWLWGFSCCCYRRSPPPTMLRPPAEMISPWYEILPITNNIIIIDLIIYAGFYTVNPFVFGKEFCSAFYAFLLWNC